MILSKAWNAESGRQGCSKTLMRILLCRQHVLWYDFGCSRNLSWTHSHIRRKVIFCLMLQIDRKIRLAPIKELRNTDKCLFLITPLKSYGTEQFSQHHTRERFLTIAQEKLLHFSFTIYIVNSWTTTKKSSSTHNYIVDGTTKIKEVFRIHAC